MSGITVARRGALASTLAATPPGTPPPPPRQNFNNQAVQRAATR